MESAAKRAKKAVLPKDFPASFSQEFGAWDAVLSPVSTRERFLVSLIQSDEDGATREYRATFCSETSARRFWQYAREADHVWSGAAVYLLSRLITLHDEVKQTIESGVLSPDHPELWWKQYIELVGLNKLECPIWTEVSESKQSWDNLDQDWASVCPTEPIRAVFRLAMYC